MLLAAVGIVANPVSGKDIRRLVAHGSVFDNQEKVRIVRRILKGLEATGTEQVFYMPDSYAIVGRALRGCAVSMDVTPVPMTLTDSQDDSTTAAAWMEANGVGCIVVLGGDGTCRAVVKGTRRIPLLPISTGTNNVFPSFMEATIAGLTAGLAARRSHQAEDLGYRSCCLEILSGDTVLDVALVDVAVHEGSFIGARAVWDVDKLSQIFLSRCRPESIGLSAVGGQLLTIEPQDPVGLHILLGNGSKRVSAAIAPGLFRQVPIASYETMSPLKAYPVLSDRCVLALDGEREVEVTPSRPVRVRLSIQGPVVVDAAKVMRRAQKDGVFVSTH
ncbi:NAD(+)/NADH kinase [Desulfacinum infernum]|uniref:ATP-NAD kinase family protein n=1 Tax=Desulfacinum infernum TaxID=35837 RepID=UPI000A079357